MLNRTETAPAQKEAGEERAMSTRKPLPRLLDALLGGAIGGLMGIALGIFMLAGPWAEATLEMYEDGIFAGSAHCSTSKTEAGETLLSCQFPVGMP